MKRLSPRRPPLPDDAVDGGLRERDRRPSSPPALLLELLLSPLIELGVPLADDGVPDRGKKADSGDSSGPASARGEASVPAAGSMKASSRAAARKDAEAGSSGT